MINKLLSLAKTMEGQWDQQTSTFGDLSLTLLENFDNRVPLDEFEDELAQWLSCQPIPRQLNLYNGFGQPPVTLFNNGLFVLDLYFWTDIDTSIHSHAFSGAFKVLYGRSVHEVFSVQTKEKLSSDVILTNIKASSKVLITAGECVKIKQGLDFNHRLIHLDRPTITLCLRTIDDKQKQQWHHFTNGLSVEKKELASQVLKGLYYADYLILRDEKRGESFLESLMGKWSHSTLLNMYEKLMQDTFGLSERTLQLFFHFFENLCEHTVWFKLYEEFYRTLQESYIELGGDGARERFLEHALNFNYTKEEAKAVLSQINSEELSDEEAHLLQTLP